MVEPIGPQSSLHRTTAAMKTLQLLLPCAVALLTVVPEPVVSQDATERRTVAVTAYLNDTGDPRYDNLGRALSSMMISDLSVLERIQLVERERIESLTQEMDLQQAGYVDPETTLTLGMMVGAEWVVTGAFLTMDPEMRLDTRVASVANHEIVAAAEVVGQSEALFELQQRLADQVLEGMELALTEEEAELLRAQQEANRIDDLETMTRFSEALCLVDYGAFVDAAEVLAEVQSRAPGSVIVRATLGLARDRAEREVADRLRQEANRRIGSLLGRRSQPERPPRPVQCG